MDMVEFDSVCVNSAADPKSEDFTASLAESLTKVVKVEKPHVLTYLRLRSDNSVRELTNLLKDYSASQKVSPLPAIPGTPLPPDEEQPPRPPSQAGRPPSRPGTSLANNDDIGAQNPSRPKTPLADEKTIQEAKSKARKERLEAYPTSAYRAGFPGCWLGGEADRRRKKEQNEGKAAFDKVWRPECVEGLERWRANGAGEKRVKALAEKCRGLYSVWTRLAGPKTTYRRNHRGVGTRGSVKITKDRNRSEVPIGSIYSIDPWELEASEQRTKDLMSKLRETKAAQERMKGHLGRPKEEKQLVSYPQVASLRESAEVKACFSICARQTGRSEYRSKFQV